MVTTQVENKLCHKKHKKAQKLLKKDKKMKTDDEVMKLCDVVRQTGYDIHCYHGSGHREQLYHRALFHRLEKSGQKIFEQFPIKIYDEDGTLLCDYHADLLVEKRLIVEIKAVRAIAPEHIAQILGYLRGSRIRHGLLMNFGGVKFEVRKYVI